MKSFSFSVNRRVVKEEHDKAQCHLNIYFFSGYKIFLYLIAASHLKEVRDLSYQIPVPCEFYVD